MAGPPVTNRQREAMRSLRLDGLSLEEIAARMGRTGKCVFDHTHDLGISCRPGRPGLGADGYARLLAAAEAGVSHGELAERFGLNRSSIGPTLSRLRRARRLTVKEPIAC